jgi:purine-binding chemotaxis protein CheW
MNERLQYLNFCVDDRCYGLPLGQAQRVVRAVDCIPIPGAPEIVLGVIDFHGNLMPVMDIRRRFGLEGREIGIDDALIIARTSKRTVALAVDRVIGVADYPADSMTTTEELSSHTDQIEGVIQSPDGLALIHNLDRFLYPEEDQALEQALTEQREHGI